MAPNISKNFYLGSYVEKQSASHGDYHRRSSSADVVDAISQLNTQMAAISTMLKTNQDHMATMLENQNKMLELMRNYVITKFKT